MRPVSNAQLNQEHDLNSLFLVFLDSIEGQSAASQRNYRLRLKQFLQRYGEYTPRQVQRRHINRWHEWLKKRDLAGPTMAGYRQGVRAFFNWLVSEGYIERNPTDHLKIGTYLPAAHKLPPEEYVERITQMVLGWLEERRAARRTVLGNQWRAPEPVLRRAYPDPRFVRDAAIWLLARGCGPRSQEICNLRLTTLRRSLERGPREDGIYLTSSHGKTGATILRFDERTAQALRDWIEARPDALLDYVFVTTRSFRGGLHEGYRPLERSTLAHILVRLAREAGLPHPIYTHALRHRIGHMTTKQFGPKVAALLLNHRDAQTAATAIAFYHHPDESDVSRAVMALG